MGGVGLYFAYGLVPKGSLVRSLVLRLAMFNRGWDLSEVDSGGRWLVHWDSALGRANAALVEGVNKLVYCSVLVENKGSWGQVYNTAIRTQHPSSECSGSSPISAFTLTSWWCAHWDAVGDGSGYWVLVIHKGDPGWLPSFWSCPDDCGQLANWSGDRSQSWHHLL